MLAVPWQIPFCEITQVDVSTDLEIDNSIFQSLEYNKQRVGVYRSQHGDTIWKHAANSADTKIHLPLIVETPINRAYYKMVEIIRTCIVPAAKKSFHMCEAPGGFIQACVDEFKHSLREVHTSSLIGVNAPSFSPVIHQFEAGCFVHKIENNDVQQSNVKMQHVQYIGCNSCDLITADGAVDNDDAPELTEMNSVQLIASEIDLAMSLQKEGGTFIVKMFGIRLQETYKLLAILCHSYKNVQIVKPFTSRSVNDERYVVCQGFFGQNNIKVMEFEHVKIDEAWFASVQSISFNFSNDQNTAIKKALSYRHCGKGTGRKGKGGHFGRGRGRMGKK